MILKNKKKKQTDLCNYVGISNSTFSTWKKRGTSPAAEYIPNIAEFLGVSERYQLTGKSDDNYYLDPEVAVMAQEMATRPELKVLFKASRNVSKESIEAINNMIEKMTND